MSPGALLIRTVCALWLVTGHGSPPTGSQTLAQGKDAVPHVPTGLSTGNMPKYCTWNFCTSSVFGVGKSTTGNKSKRSFSGSRTHTQTQPPLYVWSAMPGAAPVLLRRVSRGRCSSHSGRRAPIPADTRPPPTKIPLHSHFWARKQ